MHLAFNSVKIWPDLKLKGYFNGSSYSNHSLSRGERVTLVRRIP